MCLIDNEHKGPCQVKPQIISQILRKYSSWFWLGNNWIVFRLNAQDTFSFLSVLSLKVCVVLFNNAINMAKMNLNVELFLYHQGISLFLFFLLLDDVASEKILSESIKINLSLYHN